jgi:centrin-1
MSSKKEPPKKAEEQSTLRRSSRSTRGSIKPVVELNKEVDEEEEEQVDNTKEQSDDDVKQTKPTRRSAARSAAVKKSTSKRGTGKNNRAKQDSTDDRDAEIKTEACAKEEESNHEMGADESTADVHDQEDEFYYELNEKEMKEINNAFEMNRMADDELLNADGLRTAMRSLGFEPRGDEIKKLMKKFAKNNKLVTRDGFHKIMAFKFSTTPTMRNDRSNDEISKVFNLLDLDKTGLITLENLKSISKELNEELTEEDLYEMIKEADEDGDFKINKEEFYNIMKKTSLY